MDTAEIGLVGQETEVSDKARRRVFTADIAGRRFSLPGDPDRRRLAWALK